MPTSTSVRSINAANGDQQFQRVASPFAIPVWADGRLAPSLRFHGGNFVEKLEYEVDTVNYRSFEFPTLGLSMSIQAGLTKQSDFFDVDGTVMSFPHWTQHVLGLICSTTAGTTRLYMERTLFPRERAMTFEVSLYSEALAAYIEPCSLSPTCTCESYNGISSPKVSRSQVQAILEHLVQAEDKMYARRMQPRDYAQQEEIVLR